MKSNDRIKVGLLTFHRAYNYGAVLQCYALKKFVNENGMDCVVIDYWPNLFRNIYYLKCKRTFRHPHIDYTIKKIKIYKLLKKRNKGFEFFLKKYVLDDIKIFTQPKQLCEKNLQFEGFITGSDQVWSDTCAGFDPVYFLNFPAAEKKYKFAYAASLGRENLPSNLQENYYERLKDFEYISMREETGARQIQKLLCKKIEVACDPTLLLKKDEWKSIASMELVPKQQYILLYYVTCGDSVRQYAHELAKKKNLFVISIPCRVDYEGLSAFDDKDLGFTVFSEASPDQFIGLISNASYVVTNSFHGTVFSIIFHKQFLSQYHLDTGRKNDRVIHLLQILGLQERIIDSVSRNIDSEINWKDVDEQIDFQIEHSQKVVSDMINIVQCNRQTMM